MGTIILIMIAIIEIAFGIYCILTKSNQKRLKSYIRIGEFSLFVILALVKVLEWSFRWYLIAAVLLVFAVKGSVSLIRNKEDNKKYRAFGVVLKAVAMLLIIAAAVIPALVFPQFKLPQMTVNMKWALL